MDPRPPPDNDDHDDADNNDDDDDDDGRYQRLPPYPYQLVYHHPFHHRDYLHHHQPPPQQHSPRKMQHPPVHVGSSPPPPPPSLHDPRPPPPPPTGMYLYPDYGPPFGPPPPQSRQHHQHHHHHQHPAHHHHHRHAVPTMANMPNYHPLPANYPPLNYYPPSPPGPYHHQPPPPIRYHYDVGRSAASDGAYRYPQEQPGRLPPPSPRVLTTPPVVEYPTTTTTTTTMRTEEREEEEREEGGGGEGRCAVELPMEIPEPSRRTERRRKRRRGGGEAVDEGGRPALADIDDDTDDDDDDDGGMEPMSGDLERRPPLSSPPSASYFDGAEEEGEKEGDTNHAGGTSVVHPALAPVAVVDVAEPAPAVAAEGGARPRIGAGGYSYSTSIVNRGFGSAYSTTGKPDDTDDPTDPVHASEAPPAHHAGATMGRIAVDDEEGGTVPSTVERSVQSYYDRHSSDATFPFDSVLTALEAYRSEHGTLSVLASHPTFAEIVNSLSENGIEDAIDFLWERNFTLLREYKERAGDCDVPFTDETLGSWVVVQRRLFAARMRRREVDTGGKGGCVGISERMQPRLRFIPDETNDKHFDRFERLSGLGFDFTTPMWDVRLRELMEYRSVNGHASPPISYPKLGIWVLNQRFNLKNMPRERVAALDSLGFVWNHNRKNRSNFRWDRQYQELCEYQRQNGHCNVPATYRHSPLGTWVGKQREEYKKLMAKKSSQLDEARINKLNEIGFQWCVQAWTITSWDDRYQALVDFKAKHGHVNIPRNHPFFGNWPVYQRAQYKRYRSGKTSKLTEEKVEKLLRIGFLKTNEASSIGTGD
ncbi:hypothetical protein ACHAXA_003708 [Cyclostephanos tholiformis]|uniref:Helicase-associated domain-containing protein n=1 Tax=Cyclostephanos tholiformis TaxID=382380 RepID=A0ABD3RZ89_9STRA